LFTFCWNSSIFCFRVSNLNSGVSNPIVFIKVPWKVCSSRCPFLFLYHTGMFVFCIKYLEVAKWYQYFNEFFLTLIGLPSIVVLTSFNIHIFLKLFFSVFKYL